MMFFSAKNVLVVVAHPDDEAFGCGGTILKHVQAGAEVRLIALADGVTSRVYRHGVSRESEIKKYSKLILKRKRELFRSAAILGIKRKNCYALGLADQRLDSISLLDIVKEIERIVAGTDPDIIYTHHWGDINRDHRVCCEAVLTAFRPSKEPVKKRAVFCFEIPGNMDCLPPIEINKFKPDNVVNISSYIQSKKAAIRTYKEELKEFPSPLSLRAVVDNCRQRGKENKYGYAEAFARLQ
ncbi:MAG: PIG-L family deacetylase [Desulfotomaculaceae bacterium]